MSVSSSPFVSLIDGLVNSAENEPSRPAIRYGNTEISYGGLNDITTHLANALYATGFQSGDRVALLLSNSTPHNIIAQYGVWKAGGSLILIEPTITARELYPLLKTSQANTMFVGTPHYDLFKRSQSDTRARRVIIARVSDYLTGADKWKFQLLHARRSKHQIEQHYRDMRWKDVLKLGAKAPEVNVAISAETAALLINGESVSHGALSAEHLSSAPVQFQGQARYHLPLQRGQTISLTPDF